MAVFQFLASLLVLVNVIHWSQSAPTMNSHINSTQIAEVNSSKLNGANETQIPQVNCTKLDHILVSVQILTAHCI